MPSAPSPLRLRVQIEEAFKVGTGTKGEDSQRGYALFRCGPEGEILTFPRVFLKPCGSGSDRPYGHRVGHLPPKTPVLGCPGDRFEALWWGVGIAGPGHLLQGVGSGDRHAGPENGRIIAHMTHQRPLRALTIPQGQGWFEIGRPWNHFDALAGVPAAAGFRRARPVRSLCLPPVLGFEWVSSRS